MNACVHVMPSAPIMSSRLFMSRYIAQEVAAEQRDAITRKVQEIFPEINLPDL